MWHSFSAFGQEGVCVKCLIQQFGSIPPGEVSGKILVARPLWWQVINVCMHVTVCGLTVPEVTCECGAYTQALRASKWGPLHLR